MIRTTVATLSLALTLTGCSSLMGSLRKDFDDQQYENEPVYGGRFSERGLLDREEMEDPGEPYSGTVGHKDRSPASERTDPETTDDEESSRFSSATGNGDRPPSVKRRYRNGQRATRADFVDDANQNEGSLWASDGQTNYYFTKNKVRGIGDLISVAIEEPLLKDVGREIQRNLSALERENELALAQERLRRKAMGLAEDENAATDQTKQSAAAPVRAPAGTGEATEKKNDGAVPEATLADINVLKSLDIKSGDTIMAEIIERYPNGNYRIRGNRRVAYRGGRSKLLGFTAIAKGSDITEEDQITSGKLYEYRIEEILD